MKNISIRIKLIGGFLVLLLLVCSGLGIIAYDRVSRAVLGQVQENIPLMARDGARLVESRLDYHLTVAETVATNQAIRSMDWEQQKRVLEEETSRLGYLGMGIISPDGQARYPDGSTAELGDRSYFKQAMDGKTVFSDMIISRVINMPVFIIASPIKGNRGQVQGVLLIRADGAMLSNITDNLGYGQTGYAYIIDGKGALIAHDNRDFVMDQRNFIEEARTDQVFAPLAAMFTRMTRGESGFDEYQFMGTDRFFGYAPIEGTDWSIAVGAMKDDVFAPIYDLRWAVGIASAVFLIIGMALALVISRAITLPMNNLMRYAQTVAQGDLETQSGIDQKDEIGMLNQNIQSMVKTLSEKMKEAEHQSELARQETQKAQIATDEAEEARKQAESAKREGMLQAASSIETIVERLTSASEELSAQVEQASKGSEEQKNRTGEAATAMEEMNATVLEVARNASSAAEGSDKAKHKAQEGSEVVIGSVAAINQVENQAKTMMGNMSKLGEQAEQIGKIMNVIDDIADQTNLLALNAAIEAARAGDAGRGFAVVADEVRKLAEKTMNATKEVGDAISAIQEGTRSNIQGMEQEVQAVAEATQLANKSGEALKEIVSLVETSSDQVRSIATASEEQSSASEEINQSIDVINQISSETSEVMIQSAQAISELAKQAGELQGLVEKLKQG